MTAHATDGEAQQQQAGPREHAAVQHSYVPQLDALRAVAVLAVMLFHLKADWLPGGFVGVDIFFVLSGYVVSASLASGGERSLPEFALRFYAKRILRIVPALLLCLFVTAVLTTLFVPVSWLTTGSRDAIWLGFFGVSNFALMNGGDPYFSPRTEFNTATHTWSLGVEEQFYLVFPLVWFFWVRGLRSGASFGSSTARWAAWLLVLLLLASLAFSTFASQFSAVVAYYAMPSRFWELGAGALLLAMHRRGRFLAGRSWSHDVQLAIGVLLLGLAVALSKESPFPMPWALLSVAGALTFIDAVMAPAGEDPAFRRVLGMWLLPAIGRISYSLYLWHWPVYVLLRWTVGLDGAVERAIAVVATFFAALASYQLLERPIRSSPALLRCPPWQIVVGGVACVIATALMADSVMVRQYRFALSQTRNTESWYPREWQGTSLDGCQAKLGRWIPVADGYRRDSVRSGCARPEAERTVFVLGDSHATALETLLTRTAAEHNVRVALYNKVGCSFLSMMEPIRGQCLPFADAAWSEIISKARLGDIVVLSSLRLPRLGNAWTQFSQDEVMARWSSAETHVEREAAKAEAEAEAFITRAEHAGLTVIMTAPTPIFKAPAFRCSDWFNERNPVCAAGLQMPKIVLEKFRQPVLDAYRDLGNKHLTMRVWDAFPVLCPGETCDAFRDGKPLFSDGDHLSGYANLLLNDSFIAALGLLDARP